MARNIKDLKYNPKHLKILLILFTGITRENYFNDIMLQLHNTKLSSQKLDKVDRTMVPKFVHNMKR